MEENLYDGCLEWIKGELRPFGIRDISMVRSGRELLKCNFSDYSALFIGGGNTYRLLTTLKTSGCFDKIKRFITENGTIMGGSAGAIIFGKDIHCADYADDNITGLKNTEGFNILNGYDICCHFGSRDEEQNRYEYGVIGKYANSCRKVIALPEDAHLFAEDNSITVIGPGNAYIFDHNEVEELKSGTVINKAISSTLKQRGSYGNRSFHT